MLKDAMLRVQRGQNTSKDDLLLCREFERRYQPHKIDNHIYDADEMKQDYLWACWNAIPRAKMDVGDPILFCVRRGRGAMLDYYRRIGSQRLFRVCMDCGYKHTYDARITNCRECGCEAFTSIEKTQAVDYVETIGGTYTQTPEQGFIKDDAIEFVKKWILDSNLSPHYKEYAAGAIENQMSWYQYAMTLDRGKSFARKFSKRMRELVSPIKTQALSI